MSSFFGIQLLVVVLLHLLVLASCHNDEASAIGGGIILVLGATGRTGSLLYHELVAKQQQQNQPTTPGVREDGRTATSAFLNIINTSTNNVRALVRSVDKAREILQCSTCDEKEGIYVGDIQNLTSLLDSGAFENVQIVAIATGVSGRGSPSTSDIAAVEFIGVQNAVRALALAAKREQERERQHDVAVTDRRVVLCSSRGTTTPSSNKLFGDILFYKLNAEAFLGSIGMVTSIVKPCGLSDETGSNRTLLALHDDAPTPTGSQMIPRADVARVMAHLVRNPPRQNLRFDLCSIEGRATTDLDKLVESAQWDWQDFDGSATASVTDTTGPDTSVESQIEKSTSLYESVSRTMQGVPSRFLPPK